MYGRRWSVACMRKCVRVSDYVSVHVCERTVCVCRCMYIQKKREKCRLTLDERRVKRGCPMVACVNKMVFGTQRHRETGTLVISFYCLRVRAPSPTSSRAYAYTRLYLTIYYLQYKWERILFRLIPRSNSRYSVCAKTCPIWNSLRCGLYANSQRDKEIIITYTIWKRLDTRHDCMRRDGDEMGGGRYSQNFRITLRAVRSSIGYSGSDRFEETLQPKIGRHHWGNILQLDSIPSGLIRMLPFVT